MSGDSPAPKDGLHPGNPHRFRYDFPALIASTPALASFVAVNRFGGESVDFSDPEAVKTLNRALLRHFYGIERWDIPDGYLCPPIPGRADYIHHTADLLKRLHGGVIPTGPSVRALDVGVGANCVYPIIGSRTFGWRFTGSDTDPVSVASARAIVDANPVLAGLVDIRLQSSPANIFRGIVEAGERFDLVICNPPFHASAAEAAAATSRKLTNLAGAGGRGKGDSRAPCGIPRGRPRGKGDSRSTNDNPRDQRTALSTGVNPRDQRTALSTGVTPRDQRTALSTGVTPRDQRTTLSTTTSAREQLSSLAAPLNFGGQSNELWCPGGEVAFIRSMIAESVQMPETCLWFTSLVSKSASLPAVHQALDKAKAVQVRTIDMAQGQKSSRFVAWTFLSEVQQASWVLGHWQ